MNEIKLEVLINYYKKFTPQLLYIIENIFILSAVQLPAFIFGIVIGFTGPNLELFKSDQTPLKNGKITIEQESLIGSIGTFGSIATVFLYAWICEKFGRKPSILLIGVPQTLAWIIMALADDVTMICISRLLSGIAGAGCFYVVPVYVVEIASKNIRGSLCALFAIVCNIGIFSEFVIAEYLNYRVAAAYISFISIIFMVGFSFMPESPQFLISKGKVSEAEVAFKFFRGQQQSETLSENDQKDFNSILEIPEKANTESTFELLREYLAQPGGVKIIFIAFVVTQFPIMSGFFVLISYNQSIFQATEATMLSVFWSSLLFAFIQVIASLFTAKYIDKIGRRIILISSSFATAFCLAIFSGYMFLKTRTSLDMTGVSWIALVSLLMQIFVSSIGIIQVPNFYVPEILDQKVRGIVISCTSFWSSIEGFLVVMLYPPVAARFGIDTVIIFFALASCFCGVFALLFLPETNGRNLQEIAKSLAEENSAIKTAKTWKPQN